MPSHGKRQTYGEMFIAIAVFSVSHIAEASWVTMMAISSNGGTNGYNLLMSQGSLNDSAGRELERVDVIVSSGDFKSAMLDDWASYQPAKVRLALFNSQGGTLWYADFNLTVSSDKDPQQWLTPASLSAASDPQLTAIDLSIVFDPKKLLMTVGIGSRERLQLTWRSPSLFLFSTNYWTTLPTVLTHPVQPVQCRCCCQDPDVDNCRRDAIFGEWLSTAPDNTSNRDMLMAKLDQPYHTFTNMSGSSIWLGFSRHLFFIGISFNRTKSGEIVKFQLYYSVQADCSKHYRDSSIFQPYLDDTAQSPNTFSLTYLDEGNNTTAVVVLDTTTAATCLWISVLEQVQPSSHDISVYTTSHDVLDAPIFALQWWLDSTSSPEPNIALTTAVTSSTTYNIMTTSSCTTTTVCEMTSPDVLTTTTMPTETMPHIVSNDDHEVTSSVVQTEAALEEMMRAVQESLMVPKGETAKFKRQFVSAPDDRPSAVLLGVVGVTCIVTVMFGVLALDFARLSRDFKHLTSNLSQCWGRLTDKTIKRQPHPSHRYPQRTGSQI